MFDTVTSSTDSDVNGSQVALSARVPVAGWGNAAAFTVYNPAPDASPTREVVLPSTNARGAL
jgi:hypothetical protein